MIERPDRALALALALAVLTLSCTGCGDDAAPADASHEHQSHMHGPNNGDLVKVTDGVWFEVSIFHDQATMIVWSHAGDHAGALNPSPLEQHPVLAFTFEGGAAKVEGQPYADAGSNAFKFTHAGLALEVPDGDLTVQIGDHAHKVALPAHHH